MNSFKETQEKYKNADLDTLLELIQVEEVAQLEIGLPIYFDKWYTVSTDLGIIAYFGNEMDACSFRLNYINRILNT